MFVACISLLVLSSALLPAQGVHRRCTEVSGGHLDGDVDALEPIIVPPGQRRHTTHIPHLDNCKQGVIVTVCDVIPPEVNLEDDLKSARILRLGPTWLPLLVEVATFCSVAPATHTTDSTTVKTTHKPLNTKTTFSDHVVPLL